MMSAKDWIRLTVAQAPEEKIRSEVFEERAPEQATPVAEASNPVLERT